MLTSGKSFMTFDSDRKHFGSNIQTFEKKKKKKKKTHIKNPIQKYFLTFFFFFFFQFRLPHTLRQI